MKVVLFCGGYGMRLREYSESIPKPMVNVGYRPILWHIMKYYAHFGFKDFILCLGWKANVIKDYFLNYDECVSNDFTLSKGGQKISLQNSDIHDWNITFVDTGINANVGQRLKAVERYVDDDEIFLANYADGLTDLYLPNMIDFHLSRRSIASFMSVRPPHSFHTVDICDDGQVSSLQVVGQAGLWMNAGYFVMSREVFDFIEEGEELVLKPFERLSQIGRLHSLKYNGFYGCMDTYKEKQSLEDMFAVGNRPWAVWDQMPGDSVEPGGSSTEPYITSRRATRFPK